ncbi:hypothetical protein DOTSEDRAFT_67610 [Dothistroma septosporum NZE10]|uniref:Uncharacterized protein n=1 Tax=Dothistroma septosporum (strain NZE10 / CBS 128990) TaxID=675120 RepID=N1PYQ3_DOTSN|nr:hypothetical protein DOTSEDRAFT_67610 [Dothistroma septosporum NZE10]
MRGRSKQEEVSRTFADLEIKHNAPRVNTEVAIEVPLGHILNLNRTAVMRLNSLVVHPSARTPDLAILCCSAFCRVIILHRDATPRMSLELCT